MRGMLTRTDVTAFLAAVALSAGLGSPREGRMATLILEGAGEAAEPRSKLGRCQITVTRAEQDTYGLRRIVLWLCEALVAGVNEGSFVCSSVYRHVLLRVVYIRPRHMEVLHDHGVIRRRRRGASRIGGGGLSTACEG